MIKKLMKKAILPLWYKLCCTRRIGKNILFLEVRGEKLSSDFNMIIREIKKDEELKDYKIVSHFLTLDRGTKPKYVSRCFSLMPKLAKAKYVVMNEGSTVVAALKLRRGTKLVQTWHGAGALKKFGLDVETDKKSFNNEDIVTISSESVRHFYSQAMGISEDKILDIGVPHTDLYFKKGFQRHCKELKKQLLGDSKKKVVLYAPTYRGNISQAKDPQGLNLDLMYKHLGQEYVVISKLHSALRPVRRSYRRKEFYTDVSGRWSIEEALMICDILITDYAALVFDYSLLNKPVILFAYDLDEYEKNPGLYLDYRNEMPGKIVSSTMEVIKEIKNGCIDVTGMKAFRDKYMNSCDGSSTKRLLDCMKEHN